MQIFKTAWEIILDILIHPVAKFSNFIYRTPPNEWSLGNKGDVILVQGFGGTWSYLIRIGNFVNNLGYKIHVLEKLGNNTAKIEKCSKILENYILENEIKNAKVICHSKGGIITKYFLTTSKYKDRVSKVISISSPFGGTLLGHVNIFNLGEVALSSKLIKNLEQKKSVNNKFTNLYARTDEIVIPNKSLILQEAQNIKIDIAGHIRILDSPKTLKEIEKALANA